MEQRITQMKVSSSPSTNNTLMVFFSGCQPNYNNDYFHFWKLGAETGSRYICVRDVTNRWYNTPDFKSFAAELGQVIARITPERTVFIGSSMGGYGALKYGLELLPDKVLVFSTQIETPFGPNLADLYKMFPSPPSVTAHLCKTSKNKKWDDIGAAEQLREKAGATVVLHDCNDHNCAELIIPNGQLTGILKGEIKI